MMITPLAPRIPYSVKLAASFNTSMEAMSLGLIPVSALWGPGSIGIPSMTYRGSLLALIDEPPLMRIASCPSGVRPTQTPGKRAINAFSMVSPGLR